MPYVPTPDDRNSVVIVKQFTYRGATRLFSNRYHYEGDLPTTSGHFDTMADNITAAEKLIFSSQVELVEAIFHDQSSATDTNLNGDAVYTKTYSLAGTFAPGVGVQSLPGDCAALVRYATPARSVRNHPVYLMNYYHCVYRDSGNRDLLDSDQLAAMEDYADAWIGGFGDGAENHERCGPHGAVAIARRVDPVIRHRDFPV